MPLFQKLIADLQPGTSSETNNDSSAKGNNSLPTCGEVTHVALPNREQFVVLRSGDSVVIEPLENVILRGTTYVMRNSVFKPQFHKNSSKSSDQ